MDSLWRAKKVGGGVETQVNSLPPLQAHSLEFLIQVLSLEEAQKVHKEQGEAYEKHHSNQVPEKSLILSKVPSDS